MWFNLYGRPYLLLVTTSAAWASNAVASRLAVGHVSPALLTCGRWALVLAMIAFFCRGTVKQGWGMVRPQWPALMVMGALGLTVFNCLYYLAAHYTLAVNISIIQGAVPVLVLFGALVLHRTPVRLGQSIGLGVAMLGVVLVATRGDLATLAGLELNRGDLLMLLASAIYAGFTLALSGRPGTSSVALFACLAVGAFVASLPLVAWEAAANQLIWPTGRGWAVLVYMAIALSMAQMFFNRAVELIGPGRAGLFVNLNPAFGAVLAVAVLQEPFRIYHAAALCLGLAGLALAERSAR
jgi:drug/metabolite transporter (DMT)-like permease